ncbi:MAG: class I SAM-dependent methyltransferase [Candidatus Omnitrophica bacterium]|nr:class I SAM-dependent methyltransferase [Candidatus Omnitrophota bacterium]
MTRIDAKQKQHLAQDSQLDDYRQRGAAHLGPWSSNIWRSDPKHLGFLLARYKFCAKMLAGCVRVLEVGCGDAIGIPVMLQTVGFVHGVDLEPFVIHDAQDRLWHEGIKKCRFSVLDITKNRVTGRKFDAAYSLDVIEHIPRVLERHFVRNICKSLAPQGILILGTPNKEARKYASPRSRIAHVNLKNSEGLRKLLTRCFHNVFVFSMNDEIVHTGFYPMAHYLMAVGVGVKKNGR